MNIYVCIYTPSLHNTVCIYGSDGLMSSLYVWSSNTVSWSGLQIAFFCDVPSNAGMCCSGTPCSFVYCTFSDKIPSFRKTHSTYSTVMPTGWPTIQDWPVWHKAPKCCYCTVTLYCILQYDILLCSVYCGLMLCSPQCGMMFCVVQYGILLCIAHCHIMLSGAW